MSNNDTVVLNKIAHSSETAERLFTWMALRERHRGPINVPKIKRALRHENEPINDAEFEQALQDLSKAGYGKVIKNHKGEIVYFQLHHPVYQIGKAAIEGKPLTAAKKVEKKVVYGSQKPKLTLAVNNKTVKTVLYYFVNGERMKLEIQGDVPSETLDKIIATLQENKKSAASR